jgi:phosphotriesterase-related protein
MEPSTLHSEAETDNPAIQTVTGKIPQSQGGIIDAHDHVWINPPPGVANLPTLNNEELILRELHEFKKSSGDTILDCQPGGCGRDGNKLLSLSNNSAVQIVASTGFHLNRYYPDDYWLFTTNPEDACRFFIDEIRSGLTECPSVQAGLIKIAIKETLEESETQLIRAAANAAIKTEAAVVIHTERGKGAEDIIQLLRDLGVSHHKLILCHMDKRPDLGLHKSLAEEGILLEYDTFFRSKYQPERYTWPLLESLVNEGFEDHIAIALDFADSRLWRSFGGSPGLSSLTKEILPKLETLGFSQVVITKLLGNNVSARIAF